MSRYRLEYQADGPAGPQIMSLPVPNIATALIVADINLRHGSAEIWDGDTHLARVQKQRGRNSTYWRVC